MMLFGPLPAGMPRHGYDWSKTASSATWPLSHGNLSASTVTTAQENQSVENEYLDLSNL
jgi:hypothetical protein